jgi:hypothetical protein
MISVVMTLSGIWPLAILSGLVVILLLFLVTVLIAVVRARPEDLPALLAALTRYLPRRR